QIWLRYNSSLRDENIFITAFADAAKYPVFRDASANRSSRWLGYYGVDATRLRIAERKATEDDAHAVTTAASEERHQRWSAVEEALAPAISTTSPKVASTEPNQRDYSGLAGSALGTSSIVPRQPFSPPTFRRAASRATREAPGP
ncbi:hypothetical protein OY671_012965, partial [Metschnikowia pulcherrima]